ncbi:MAG: SIS domain-containing protein [Sedimentisphaerales bacterium]|nr:SIS domain-containing protein [Sedimentisphaerales bacterium]
MKKTILDTIAIHKKLLADFETGGIEHVIAAAEMIIAAIKNGGRLYLCGNGGSASDAQHVAGEFIGRFKKERKALPAVALTADSAILTCIGNDYGFKDVFARQIEGLMTEKDVLWAFSCSGTSPNIIAAAQAAKAKKAKILAFTGKQKSPLESMADVCVCIAAPSSGAAQEIHQLAYHIICDLVEQKLCP